MVAMSRAQFRKELQEGLKNLFGISYKGYPEEWRHIFDVETSSKAYEEDQQLVGLGGAQVKAEGAAFNYDAGGEGYTSRYHHETIATGFAITMEAVEDNLYGKIANKYTRSMAEGLQFTKEVKGAEILNNGFDSSYSGGDGKSLFATDHPLWGGGTLSNKLSTAADLSEAALEDAMIAIRDFVDDRGIPKMIRAKKLIIPSSSMFIADRILNSNGRVGTADNDVNSLKNQSMIPEGFCVNDYLADQDAWYIKTDCADGLKHMKRRGVKNGMEGDFETDNVKYKANERYSFGWTDFRGAFASEGAA